MSQFLTRLSRQRQPARESERRGVINASLLSVQVAWESPGGKLDEDMLLKTDFGSLRVQDAAQAGMADAVAQQILASVLDIARQFSLQGVGEGVCGKAAGLPGETFDDWMVEMNKNTSEKFAAVSAE